MPKKLISRSKKEEKKLEPWEEDLLDFDKIWEISSKEFDVSEARLESAIELKERFENQLEKLNEKSKGDN